MTKGHPVTGLDDVVHQRVRLGILAILDEEGSADFGALRDELEVSDGNLSQHIRVLEEAGYVRSEKGFVGRRPRTTVRITKEGRRALGQEVALLRELIGNGNAPIAAAKVAPAKVQVAPVRKRATVRPKLA